MKISPKLDIIVSFDSVDKVLFDTFFCDSFYASNLEEYFDLHTNHIAIDNDIVDYGFLSNRYIQCRIQQYTRIIDYIKTATANQLDHYAICMDTDIILFPYFATKIKLLTENSNSDLFFMSENINLSLPNVGFIIFKSNEKTLHFFEELLSVYESKDADNIKHIAQIAKGYLEGMDIKYEILDLSFANNNYPAFKYKRLLLDNKLSCFHATNSFNIIDKINILSKICANNRKYRKTFVLPHDKNDWIALLSSQNDQVISYEHILEKKNTAKTNENQKENKNIEAILPIEIYIEYIIQYYDDLADYTFFLSDDVFETTDLAKYLIPNNTLHEICDICNIRGGVMCVGSTVTGSTDLNLPNKPYSLSVAYFLDRICDIPNEDLASIEYGKSDCYIIRKQNIVNRPKQFYENLKTFIQSNDYNPSIIEKLILYIFDLKISLRYEDGSVIL